MKCRRCDGLLYVPIYCKINAEGCGRNSDAELARFLEISMGSANELEYLLLLTRDINLLNNPNYSELTNEVIEVKRMLASFIKKLRADGLKL